MSWRVYQGVYGPIMLAYRDKTKYTNNNNNYGSLWQFFTTEGNIRLPPLTYEKQARGEREEPTI